MAYGTPKPNRKARCYECSRTRPKEDLEVTVLQINHYTDGSVDALLRCDWCGNEWNAVSGWEKYPTAKKAKHWYAPDRRYGLYG